MAIDIIMAKNAKKKQVVTFLSNSIPEGEGRYGSAGAKTVYGSLWPPSRIINWGP